MGNFFDAIKDDLDALDVDGVFSRASFGVDYDSDSGSVLAVQNAVNAAGYSPALTTDGVYGPHTGAGVSWLQGQKGIPVTGVIDAATLNALGLPVPAAAVVPASTAETTAPVEMLASRVALFEPPSVTSRATRLCVPASTQAAKV